MRGCSSSARAIPTCSILEGRDARHFPQDADGSYAGYHPAGSADAISHLKSLQRAGAGYLLIPGPALWWLEHYAGFGEYLADVRRGGVPRDRSVRDLPPVAASTRRLIIGSIEFKHHEPVEVVCS